MDTHIIAAALAGAAVGIAGGYLLGRRDVKRRLEDEYAELAFQDIQDVKEHYKKLYKEGEYSDPTTLAAARGLISEEGYDSSEDLLEMTADQGAEVLEGVNRGDVKLRIMDVSISEDGLGSLEIVGEVHRNIFDEHNEERENLRAQGKPFVISNDEFGEEPHWDTVSLSYFEEDDVLMDSDEKPIDTVEKLVGKANLGRFGAYPDEDPNVLFIRNEAIRTDFEIAKEEGSYTKTVLGVDPEPPKRRPRTRPRPSDDDE